MKHFCDQHCLLRFYCQQNEPNLATQKGPENLQYEDDWKKEYVPVPIPVPIYVPVPMNMYSQTVPVPTSIPVPVPVPIFLPTTLDSTEKIFAAIEDLRGKVPSNPLETELLTVSEMVSEHDGKAEVSDVASELVTMSLVLWSAIAESNLLNSETEAQTSLPDVPYEPDLDIEIDFPRATEELDTENEFLLPPVFGEEYEEQPRPRPKKKVMLSC
ncbi:hypothetical protein CIB84_008583 [Bambusicola thoracicus]|uniref:Uncharacterized protein n=1 Tax=Bambusicola thoracicus TaxID=9083 RepID=A0A2P4SU75_BAMTH|nr:hypothetical protein CIB84_008583 [Bambusicola thoracicus]